MKLPRRVPWTSLAELDEVSSWIFSDPSDTETSWKAIHRLAAWAQITPLPHALDATLALLTVLIQDAPSAYSQQTGHLPVLHLRLAYAAALIRLVNGLVDPLQQGVYARPIAAIAAQLGLPGWLVEMRHGATHEELPSLEVLREGSRQSMAWLYANYFLPILSPGASSISDDSSSLRPLSPHLKLYKTLQKQLIRDASLRSTLAPELARALRDVERWVAEARVAAAVLDGGGLDGTFELDAHGFGSDASSQKDVDSKERWALEHVCEALVARGSLVPQSKKKRTYTETPFSPSAPLIALWEPLLSYLRAHHPVFSEVLLSCLVAALTSPTPTKGDGTTDAGLRTDSSYELSVAAWIAWLVNTWSATTSRQDMILSIVTRIGFEEKSQSKSSRTLLAALLPSHSEITSITNVLGMLPSGNMNVWEGSMLDEMEIRLRHLVDEQNNTSADKPILSKDTGAQTINLDPIAQLPTGWRMVDEKTWRPSPIGVFSAALSA